jgi:hypothetical protein
LNLATDRGPGMATSGDRYLATSGDFFMATDRLRTTKALDLPRPKGQSVRQDHEGATESAQSIELPGADLSNEETVRSSTSQRVNSGAMSRPGRYAAEWGSRRRLTPAFSLGRLRPR